MKKKALFFCLATLSAGFLFAQDSQEPFRKAIYVEGLGSGILLSSHYDMRLQRGRQDGLGVRAGVGGGNFSGTTTDGDDVAFGLLTLPVGMNYVVGKRRSGFEAGIGATFLYANVDAVLDDNIVEGSGWGVLGVINIGYRLQPLRNGFLLRFNWSPVFGQGYSSAWFGLSMGFSFR